MRSGVVQRIERLVGSKTFPLLALAAILAAAGFLTASSRTYGIGFSLDDAWIHQTYARNLARNGEWSFLPGQPSAGSTAPLWSLALALGHWLGTPSTAWAFGLGILCLIGIAFTGEHIFHSQTRLGGGIPWLGIFLALEWHLVWAALSGMETALYAFLILIVFGWLFMQRPPWLLAGLATGVIVWLRPDGFTLLGPALFLAGMQAKSWRLRIANGFQVLLGFGLLFIPYLLFNHALAGNWWPNTFYAKQAEYAILQEIPVAQRFLSLASLPLVGAGSVLLPGWFYLAWTAWRRKNWPVMAAILWWLGYTFLYALRLPVTYQHGRYLIPAMPVFFILAASGWVEILHFLRSDQRWRRVLRQTWILAIALVSAGFYGMGALAYAEDVAIIESEMVQTAQWIAAHTTEEDVIAVHDIGAMGYFSRRKLIDLAGLVSPEVIPMIRDEDRLKDYLDQLQVDYLVTFPGWYPRLVSGKTAVYQTGAEFAPRNGGENMHVYKWR